MERYQQCELIFPRAIDDSNYAEIYPLAVVKTKFEYVPYVKHNASVKPQETDVDKSLEEDQ